MTTDLFTEIVDSLTYAIHAAAARRNPNAVTDLVDTRDRFVRLHPDLSAEYVPQGDR